MNRRCPRSYSAVLLALLAGLPSVVGAQTAPEQPAPAEPTPAAAPGTPQRTPAELIKERKAAEQEMRKIRAKHLGPIRVTEIRQAGIAKLLAFDDPKFYASLIEVCKDEGADVRTALIDFFSTRDGEAASGALAWIAIADKDDTLRARAGAVIRDRIGAVGYGDPKSWAVAETIRRGLAGSSDTTAGRAAELAQTLQWYGIIPHLIVSQALATTRQGDRQGDLAWIAIGKQHAFISDLQPVVADNAVGFDPQLSVINEGTLLRIQDAVVTTYRTIVNRVLIDMSGKVTGRSTEGLGYNTEAWKRWYTDEFSPEYAKRRGELAGSAPKGD